MRDIDRDRARIRDFLRSRERTLVIDYMRGDGRYLPYFCRLLHGTLRARLNGLGFILHRHMYSVALKGALYRLAGVSIGRDAYLGPGVLLDPCFPELCEIGAGALIGIDTRIAGHEISIDRLTLGRVTIGAGAIVGARSTVKCGVSIGERAEVGTASVVHRDIPAGAAALGNPARVIHKTMRGSAPPPAQG